MLRDEYERNYIMDQLYTRSTRSIVYKSRGQMSTTEVRKRREEQQVEIRRQRREENVAKRRNLFASADGPDSDDEGAIEWEAQVGLASSAVAI